MSRFGCEKIMIKLIFLILFFKKNKAGPGFDAKICLNEKSINKYFFIFVYNLFSLGIVSTGWPAP